jgi:hypothetical protein
MQFSIFKDVGTSWFCHQWLYSIASTRFHVNESIMLWNSYFEINLVANKKNLASLPAKNWQCQNGKSHFSMVLYQIRRCNFWTPLCRHVMFVFFIIRNHFCTRLWLFGVSVMKIDSFRLKSVTQDTRKTAFFHRFTSVFWKIFGNARVYLSIPYTVV